MPGGAALLTEAAALLTQYTTAHTAQDQRKNRVKTSATDLDADETDLLTELFGVYAALLAHYYRTPERAEAYFDFAVLPPSYPEDSSARATGIFRNPEASVAAEIGLRWRRPPARPLA